MQTGAVRLQFSHGGAWLCGIRPRSLVQQARQACQQPEMVLALFHEMHALRRRLSTTAERMTYGSKPLLQAFGPMPLGRQQSKTLCAVVSGTPSRFFAHVAQT